MNRFGTMDQCFGDIGFRPLKSDPCVYIYEDEVGFVILTLSKLLFNKLNKQLLDQFEMMNMGTCREFSV